MPLLNLYANFVKVLEICKDFSKDLVNERGNLPRRGVVPRFSDLEVISLSLPTDYRLFRTVYTQVKVSPSFVFHRS